MATDYSLNLRATLDTSEVQQKLQQLGQAGADANHQIDQAVQKLDHSIKELNQSLSKSAQQQANFGNTLKTLTRGAGAALAGQVIQSGGRLAAATGHENIAAGADYAGAALKGAGAGAAIGSMVPLIGTTVGAAVGAAVGTLNEAFEKLAQSAEDAARKLVEITQSEQRTNKMFEDAVLAENMAKFKDMDASQLAEQRGYWENQQFDYVNLVKQGRAPNQDQLVYEQQLATTKEEYDKASQMLQAISAVEEQRKQEEEKALQAAQRAAEAEKRKAEAAEKQAEAEEKMQAAEEKMQAAQRAAIAKSAAGALGSFQQQQRLQAFGESIQDLTPAELQNMKDNLAEQNSALAGKVTDLFSYAQTTGSAADLEAAQNALSEFNEGSSMLKMVEGLLDGISGAGEGGLPSILQSMQALGTEAQKGYDTSGYGNLDQQMLKVEQETKDAAKESAGALRSINAKLDEVKNVIVQNGNGVAWG